MEVLVIFMGWQNMASTEHFYKRTQSSSSVSFNSVLWLRHFRLIMLSLSDFRPLKGKPVAYCSDWAVIVHSLLPYIKDPGQRTVAKIIANPATPPVPGTPLLANHTAKMQNCNTTTKPLTTCTCTDTIWPSVILCST